MDDRSHDGAERDAEDTDELLYMDFSHKNSAFELENSSLERDHCDFLLDAIDAQLDQLQIHPRKNLTISRERDCSVAASLMWSHSLGKDTGLGSTTKTNDTPMSSLDLTDTPTMEHTSERSTSCPESPVVNEETKKRLDRETTNTEEIESRREQVIWRLERLLGDTCKENAMTGEMQPPSDSICTEDFVRCFREEMVELAHPEQLHTQEEAETTEISDSDTCQGEQKGLSVLNFKRIESAVTGKSSKATMSAQYSEPNQPHQTRELDKCLSVSYEVNISHINEKAGAGERYKPPQRINDNSRKDVTEYKNLQHNSCSPKITGVPVRSFDTMSIDGDLDSVCTKQVRQRIHRQPGWETLIQSVTAIENYCTHQSDNDTPPQEESEPRSTSGQRSTHRKEQNRSPSVHKGQRSKREDSRLVCLFGDNDTDEEISNWSRGCRTDLKCEKEEETLRLQSNQLKDVELSLSELQQRKQHALQELQQLTADTAQMEKEKRTLECVLIDSRLERDSISYQLQRESFVPDLRDMEEELLTLHKQTLRDEYCKERHFFVGSPYNKQKRIIMSDLERVEIERQLDSAKTELFAEQRRAREKLESMKEKLEETCEALQRATEAEILLRDKYVCLEEKQMQKTEQMEALEARVSELQAELGECKTRLGSLEKMLAQKELQLIDFQEQHGTLQAERDGLRVELQHLKTKYYKMLKEAQKHAHSMMVHQQEEKKVSALKEQSLTQHIESMESSIQLKEEEAMQLRKALEQEKEQAKNREKELHEALEKVHKAIDEQRRKWEAEKMEAVQVHCRDLEERNRKSLENMRSEMQREKSKALAIQHHVVELKTKMQELESERTAHHREQEESRLAIICKSLKSDHQAELQRLQKQISQENRRTLLHLEQDVQLAEKEADRFRVMLEERESSHNQIKAELDQQFRSWAQELGVECQHLYLLVEKCGAKQNAMHLPPSSSLAEALTNLRILREQLKHLISHLHQELNSQKQTSQQLRKDKERELSIQRQQLRLERDQALDFLKEHLIQEHIEELSSLNCAYMRGEAADRGGVAESFRKQLKAKELELRQVQRKMGQWKEQTAARLACKFEEELTAELERKASNIQQERQKTSDGTEGEMALTAKEAQNLLCSPFRRAVGSAASYSPSDVSSFKLLCYLQSRVKQLRVENQTYTCSPIPPNKITLDMSESYLTAISQGQESAGI